MGLRNLRQFGVFVKQVWDCTFSLAKIFCFHHVTTEYLVDYSFRSGILGENISTRSGRVDRGDIVAVISPMNPRKILIKRLLGLEGDTITYVLDPNTSDDCKTIVVPEGHIWIQWDNIHGSYDSRQFGPVPYGLLYNKKFWKVSLNLRII